MPSLPVPASRPFPPVARGVFARSVRMLTPSVKRSGHGGLSVNRRTEIRRGVYLGCRVRKLVSQALVGDRSIDLSPQGMLVLSDEWLEPGDELFVSFLTTDLPIWFDTRATVARIIEGRRPGDRGRALALRFQTLPAVSRLILRGHLRKIPPTLPQRPRPQDRRIGAGFGHLPMPRFMESPTILRG
jgi:hypothetical protein